MITATPPISSARPMRAPMLAKTIPITRLAFQLRCGRAALALVLVGEDCLSPSVIRSTREERYADYGDAPSRNGCIPGLGVGGTRSARCAALAAPSRKGDSKR